MTVNQGKLWKWSPSGLNSLHRCSSQFTKPLGEGLSHWINKSHHEAKSQWPKTRCKKRYSEALEKTFGIEGRSSSTIFGLCPGMPIDLTITFSAETSVSLGVCHEDESARGKIARYAERLNYNATVILPRGPTIALMQGRAKMQSDSGDHQGAIQADTTKRLCRSKSEAYKWVAQCTIFAD